MSPKRKRKAKPKTEEKQDDPEAFGWTPGEGGLLKGAKFAKPPCPVGSMGFHQFEKPEDLQTRGCIVKRCRLCGRTLGINRKSGHVRERSVA